MVVATPSDERETRLLLTCCYQHPGPSSVRYPRGAGVGAAPGEDLATVPLGKGVVRREGKGLALLAFGPVLHEALKAAESLDATVVDMRFVKPLDEALLQELVQGHQAFVTLEEACIMGGAGSAVLEFFSRERIVAPVLQLGYPDEFIDHGDQKKIAAALGLDAAGIERAVRERFSSLLEP